MCLCWGESRYLLGRFLVSLLNPGGWDDGGAFRCAKKLQMPTIYKAPMFHTMTHVRCALEDPIMFGKTDIFDEDFAKFRRVMFDRIY